MSKNKQIILNELINKIEVTSVNLSTIINMSTRSVRTIIKEISGEIKGAKIESGSFGYRLVIESHEQFLIYIQSFQPDLDRQYTLFTQFFYEGDYHKVDDLCDMLYLSRTQLKAELKIFRENLRQYNLMLIAEANNGLIIKGKEIDIRRCMLHRGNIPIDNSIREEIIKIVDLTFEIYNFNTSDESYMELIDYVVITYLRINRERYLSDIPDYLRSIESEKEYSLAQTIINLLNQISGVEYRNDEVAYLTMQLCGKCILTQNVLNVESSIIELCNQIVYLLENESNVSFGLDLNFRLAIIKHIVPLTKRIKYKEYSRNKLTLEIKSKLIQAYELSIKVSTLINEQFDCVLPEDEIALFALHINLPLRENMEHFHKNNILLVCSSGVGSSRLLEYSFKENFSPYIKSLKVCTLQEFNTIDYQIYDCVFTTTKLQGKINIPVFNINTLFDDFERNKIKKSLQQLQSFNIMNYFPQELFIVDKEFSNKEEAIKQIVKKCSELYDIPSDFEDEVLKREKIASTELGELIAFPHTLKPIYNKTFVSVTILNKPLLWKEHKVRIILLTSIEDKENKDLELFYMVLSRFMSNKTLQLKLLNNANYEILKDILMEIGTKQ